MRRFLRTSTGPTGRSALLKQIWLLLLSCRRSYVRLVGGAEEKDLGHFVTSRDLVDQVNVDTTQEIPEGAFNWKICAVFDKNHRTAYTMHACGVSQVWAWRSHISPTPPKVRG